MCVFFCIAFSLFHLLLRFFFIFSAPYPRLKKTIMLDELSRDRMNESYEKKNRTHFQYEKLNIKKREKKTNFCFASGEFIGFFFSNLFHISFIFECFVCTAKFQLLLRSTVMLFTLVFQNVFMYCAACHPADSSTEQQTNST